MCIRDRDWFRRMRLLPRKKRRLRRQSLSKMAVFARGDSSEYIEHTFDGRVRYAVHGRGLFGRGRQSCCADVGKLFRVAPATMMQEAGDAFCVVDIRQRVGLE